MKVLAIIIDILPTFLGVGRIYVDSWVPEYMTRYCCTTVCGSIIESLIDKMINGDFRESTICPYYVTVN